MNKKIVTLMEHSDLHLQLCNRANMEFVEYRDLLMLRSKADIYEASYKTTFMQEILSQIEGGDGLSVSLMRNLLQKDNVLEYIYDRYMSDDSQGLRTVVLDTLLYAGTDDEDDN